MLERIEHESRILELRLARPPVNALSPALVAQLRPALADAGPGLSCGGVVGAPKIFPADSMSSN
jgi:enoyl-CoA hydratase/carnithine racemase